MVKRQSQCCFWSKYKFNVGLTLVCVSLWLSVVEIAFKVSDNIHRENVFCILRNYWVWPNLWEDVKGPILEKRSNPTRTCKGSGSCRWDVEVSPNVLLFFFLFNSESCFDSMEYIKFVTVWILRCFWFEIMYCWILGDEHYRTASLP